MAVSILSSAVGRQQGHLEKVRPAGVAGTFYPADPSALVAEMDALLLNASLPKIDGQIVAAVAPHAAFPYSGPVAAFTYAALKGFSFARVVVIAPSHYEAFDFTSVYDGDGYATPLGTIVVDTAFARELTKQSHSIQLSDRGHRATRQGSEHALEVQLPWLQRLLGNFDLVPIVMGSQSYESSRALGVALANGVDKKNTSKQVSGDTLIVASSDLSHYHDCAEAEKIDHRTLSALKARDYLSMSRNFEMRVWEACGGAPIVAAMIAAEHLGANHAQVLRYANTADVTGDPSHVVGYSADIFVKSQSQSSTDPPFSLNEGEKEKLLALARQSVEHIVREGKLVDVVETGDEVLDQEHGAFVTLRQEGNLRGCVGYTSAAKPLYETVRDTAALAAVRDPRFLPVKPEDLPRLEYEISVLSPLVHVSDIHEVEVGRHGLLIKNCHREGLLLPQVPVEQHWDRTRFLQETCRKSGLPEDSWMDSDTDIFRFTALVFNEFAKSG